MGGQVSVESESKASRDPLEAVAVSLTVTEPMNCSSRWWKNRSEQQHQQQRVRQRRWQLVFVDWVWVFTDSFWIWISIHWQIDLLCYLFSHSEAAVGCGVPIDPLEAGICSVWSINQIDQWSGCWSHIRRESSSGSSGVWDSAGGNWFLLTKCPLVFNISFNF